MAKPTSTTTCSIRDTARGANAARRLAGLLVACATVALGAGCRPASVPAQNQPVVRLERPPRLKPDYTDLVIPPNIAPLNFVIQETGRVYRVSLQGEGGEPIEITTRQAAVSLPLKPWRQLLAANRSGAIRLQVRAQDRDRRWTQFATITNRVAAEAVDPVLIYRKIYASHNTWSVMGLYQRDLETFAERPLLENHRFGYQCCHCHTLRQNNPNAATVIIRSRLHDNRLLVVSDGVAESFRGTVGFNAWHPSGRLMAVAISKPRLLLHTARNDMREIAELSGWLGWLRPGDTDIHPIPTLVDTNRLLAFPVWSPDGRHLYYCSAPNPWTDMTRVTAESPSTIKYDLMRVGYDVETDQWGRPEPVLLVRATGFSVAQPRISPDGRWLFFCAVAHGCWPTYDPASDIYGVDLHSGAAAGNFVWRKLELNSDQCESWLSWSANSRWVVFSSKRSSPLFNRPYLAHVSADGRCSKPFVVPRADPAAYDFELRTYTIPTLATGPIPVPQRALAAAIRQPNRPSLLIPGEQAAGKPTAATGRPAKTGERDWPTQ